MIDGNEPPIILIVAEQPATGWLLLPDSYTWRARSCADEDCVQAGLWPEALQPEGLPFTYEDAAPPTPQSPQAPGGINSGYTITRRGTYFLAGQAVAIRQVVEGGTNNLLHLHTDHLGSNSVMSYSNGGGMVGSSRTRYLPFGGYRTAPTQTYTNRGYTGQKQNAYIKLIDMRARWYDPAISRFISPDPIIPDPTNPQSLNRYSYVYNNPVRYTDSSGHCVDGITTWACIAAGIAVVTKVIDYGITAWDTYQASRTLADPTASGSAKMMAGLTVGLSILFEAIEPDDILPIGLPADDVARRAILNGAEEVLEEGGPEALEGFLRDQLGDHADDALAKLDELLGIDNVRFHEDPGQLDHIFRNDSGHFLEDTLENRNVLLDTASRNNFIKTDEFGNNWFAKLLDDGTEVWVSVRNGIIQNGGVNQVPQHIINN